jgi:aryl-alcohol dehydrogenase-like predicted oxidoreductase
LRQPGVTAPIVGATKLDQLDALVAGLGVTLTDEEAAAVEAPYRPHRVLGH